MPAAEQCGCRDGAGERGPHASAIGRAFPATWSQPLIRRKFGVYFDVGNAHTQGFDPAADLRALGGLVSQIHTKEPDQIPLMGTGPLDWDAIFAAIAAIGYDGWLVLETATGDDARASAVYNREFLEKPSGYGCDCEVRVASKTGELRSRTLVSPEVWLWNPAEA